MVWVEVLMDNLGFGWTYNSCQRFQVCLADLFHGFKPR